MPDLSSVHPSAHFSIIGTCIFIKQLLNEVVTKYIENGNISIVGPIQLTDILAKCSFRGF